MTNTDLSIRELRYGVMRLFRLTGWGAFLFGLAAMFAGLATLVITPDYISLAPTYKVIAVMLAGAILVVVGIAIWVSGLASAIPYQYETQSPEAELLVCKYCGSQPASLKDAFTYCTACKRGACLPWQAVVGRIMSKTATTIQVIVMIIISVLALA